MSAFGNLSRALTHFTKFTPKNNYLTRNSVQRCTITTSKPYNDLMEFFDDKKNWGANEVKSGRSWKTDELRLKSNADLHKLWYVLLKERNMLLTMEQECKDQVRLFPSPERIDKVEDSMTNLETVIRERNRAYFELETGETGERPQEHRVGAFGLTYLHKKTEHFIPKYLNTAWRKKFQPKVCKKDVEDFLLKCGEKRFLEKKKKNARDFGHVVGLLKRFPNMDMEALKEQYPNVDIEKAKTSKKSRGHFVPK